MVLWRRVRNCASNGRTFPGLPPDRGVVYGGCIQRLGSESGGFGQYVRLANLSTGKAVRIEVKPALRSRKQNAFCVARPVRVLPIRVHY